MFKQQPIMKIAVAAGVLTLLVCATIVISNAVIAGRPIYVQYNTGTDGKPVNNISVTATGKVNVSPDIATFTAGYTTKKKDLASVQKDLKTKSNAIVAALKEMGVAEKDIQTADFSIHPAYRWDYNSGVRTDDGHEGTVRIAVKVRNIDKTGEIIDKVAAAGANTVDSISFTVDDLETVRNEARKLAAEAARTKAGTLASASEVGLGGLISISETSYDYNPIYYNSYKEMSVAADSSAGAPTAISSGSMEISITVSATYGIN